MHAKCEQLENTIRYMCVKILKEMPLCGAAVLKYCSVAHIKSMSNNNL